MNTQRSSAQLTMKGNVWVWLLVIVVVGIGLVVFLNKYGEPNEVPPGTTYTPPAGWVAKSSGGASFYYPTSISATYISPVDWPPAVQVLSQPFSCTAGGQENARAGQTTQQTIGGHTYCVTKESEGAAGSIYTNYAYAFAKDGKTVILTFSLRFVQCANYDEPEKTKCESERSTFNIDSTIDQIAQSLTLN